MLLKTWPQGGSTKSVEPNFFAFYFIYVFLSTVD